MTSPSLSSSSLVSSSSHKYGYESIQMHQTDELKNNPQILDKENNSKNVTWSKFIFVPERKRLIVILVLVGVAIVLACGRSIFQSRITKDRNGIRVRLGTKNGVLVDNSSMFSNGDSTTESFVTGQGVPENKNYNPFSMSPVEDMGMSSIDRNDDAMPSGIWGKHYKEQKIPLPTNCWYLNLLSHQAADKPNDSTRAYTIPYIVDTVSPFPGMEGIRVHWPVTQASATNIQMVDDFKNSLCLGAEGFGSEDSTADTNDGKYTVTDGSISHLGVGLEWESERNNKKDTSTFMSTHIVRGMPFATMKYEMSQHLSAPYDSAQPVPTIYSYNGLASDVQIDLTSTFKPTTSKSPQFVCGIEGTPEKGNSMIVQSHIHLHLINSDFTWMVFFSNPVRVSCMTNREKDPKLKDFKMSIMNDVAEGDNGLLNVRIALLNQCTTGHTSIKEHCLERNQLSDPEGYEELLKHNANLFPNTPSIAFEYPTDSDNSTVLHDNNARMVIDWNATSAQEKPNDNTDHGELLMYALPHHQKLLSSLEDEGTGHCVHSFHGNTCLVRGSRWVLTENLGSPLSFFAPRPPQAQFIPIIADHLSKDIQFQLSKNTLRGASDTYFSGKVVARLARIIVIASEMKLLADASSIEDIEDEYYGDADWDVELVKESMEAASRVDLPSSDQIESAIHQLKKAVQIWLSADAEAPYIYDSSWGGLVNCGCRYVGKDENGYCNNTFPDCPALVDVNEDFGNGYYNDHHYHYGYHVYAAAVAAKYDPEWGRENFDAILLYIRDFANPYEEDEYFPQYRQKDWFLGSSWASGIVSAENSPHGRNEESSSEAISAYEGVTLFGSAMVDAFTEVMDKDETHTISVKLEAAKLIRDSGQYLTASEIQATNRYWHVWSSDSHNNTYPKSYSQPVVGMLYDTMATFQTWFAPWDVVSYGIQLIPLTPVAETRDQIEWAKILYPKYAEACLSAGAFCEENGWTILQAGLLATAGNQSDAIGQAQLVPTEVFSSEGGGGNSMTNTLWYIATRKVTHKDSQ